MRETRRSRAPHRIRQCLAAARCEQPFKAGTYHLSDEVETSGFVTSVHRIRAMDAWTTQSGRALPQVP